MTTTASIDLTKEEIAYLQRALTSYEILVPLTDKTRKDHEDIFDRLTMAEMELE